MGLIGAAFGLGFIVGPGLGGLLTQPQLGRLGYQLPIVLAAALAAVAAVGVVVFLRDPSLTSLAERLAGADRPAAVDRSLRAYGVGAQILLDLGGRDMIVMSSTRPEPTALEGYGLRIVGWRDMDGETKA